MLALSLIWQAFAAIAALVAVAALLKARQTARRLERLSESYWELRYEYGQLSARMARLEGPAVPGAEPGVRLPDGTAAFVPLSSLKKM